MERVVEPGEFDIMIGASSTDIRLQDVLAVTAPDGAACEVRKTANRFPVSMERGSEAIFPLPEGIEIDDPGCCRKTFAQYFEVLDGVMEELIKRVPLK